MISGMSGFTVSVDRVRASGVLEPIAELGDRFLRRVFTEGEIATAAPALMAACFAAKERP